MTPILSILLRHLLAKGSLLLVISGTVAGFARTGSGQEPNLLPPRVGLSAVDFPDLANLESGVREQISAVQKQLVENAGSPSIPSSELSQLYGLMGQVYHAYSLVRPAEQCYLNATRLAPADFTWIYLLGYLYQQAGRIQEAILYYSEVRRIRPDYLAAAVNLGTLCLDQNRPEEARNAFGAALAIDSSSAAAHYGLGQAAMSAVTTPKQSDNWRPFCRRFRKPIGCITFWQWPTAGWATWKGHPIISSRQVPSESVRRIRWLTG